MRLARLVVPLLLGSFGSGCSLAFVTTAPPYEESLAQIEATGNIKCTRLPILPAVDAALAAGAGLESALVVALSDDGQTDAIATAAGLGIMTVLVASAIYGFSESATCRDQYAGLRAERDQFRATHPRR